MSEALPDSTEKLESNFLSAREIGAVALTTAMFPLVIVSALQQNLSNSRFIKFANDEIGHVRHFINAARKG